VPKLARDLLPSHRGVDPGGHSIFKDLILPDDPPDGTRSLRKRKASHEEEVPQPVRTNRKKRRPSEEASKSPTQQASATASSPVARPRSARSVRSALVDAHDTEGDAQNSASDEDGHPRTRPRRIKPKKPNDKRPLVWVDEKQSGSLIIAFHLNNEKVQKIVTAKPNKNAAPPRTLSVEEERKERRRERDRITRERRRRAAQAGRESPEITHYPPVQVHYSAPFQGFSEKEDEAKSKPYGGVLSEADADTSKTYPTQADRKRFEEARAKAEEEWKEKQESLYAHLEVAKPSKQTATASKIKCVNFGGWEIDTWHAAPYPEEYSKNRVLYICEFCLKYMNSDYVAWRHKVCSSRLTNLTYTNEITA
jgi:histone acetyltransferase SAS3